MKSILAAAERAGHAGIDHSTDSAGHTMQCRPRWSDTNIVSNAGCGKIDGEGFVANVLEGGSSTREHQPIIVFEQHEQGFTDGATHSIRIPERAGYSICWYQNGDLSSNNFLLRKLQNIRDPLLIAVPSRFRGVLIDGSKREAASAPGQ